MMRYLLDETRHGTMLFDADDMFIGQAFEHYGEYSWPEAELMLSMLTPDSVVVEAGCHIGSFTIPMAKKAKTLYAFEPQRLVFQNLCANIALNGLKNVHTWQAALGERLGATLCPIPNEDQHINSGGVQLKGVTEGEVVPVYCIDWLNLPRIDLIRADIEDMEYEMVLGARESIKRCKPVVYLESNKDHDPLLQQMFDLGYDCYWHFPAIFNDGNYKNNHENIFSFESDGRKNQFVTYNLLCLPRGLFHVSNEQECGKAKIGDKCGEICTRLWQEAWEKLQ